MQTKNDVWISFSSSYVCCGCVTLVTLQGEHQRRLYKDLMQSYNPLERPVYNDSHSLTVHFSFSLMQIMDVVSSSTHMLNNLFVFHCFIQIRAAACRKHMLYITWWSTYSQMLWKTYNWTKLKAIRNLGHIKVPFKYIVASSELRVPHRHEEHVTWKLILSLEKNKAISYEVHRPTAKSLQVYSSKIQKGNSQHTVWG